MGTQRAEILRRDASKEREGGREKKRKSTDLSNRSLKTDGETERRTYTGTDIRKTFQKTDRATESRDPTE